ncbi:MAG TPA: PAS domain S-box protein, partial [Thermoplasmatales archaeon]|nr:PAS domain S-box protein [Thermoplasmatales archaeon]
LDYRIETKSKDEIGMLTDSFNKMVEELKNSRKKLEESERKYRDLFENSRDMIYISSKDGRFIDVNKAGEELLGYSRDELLKMNGADLYANREDRERFMREIAEKGFVKDYEVKYKRKDGKVITCLETASAKKDEEGNIIGYQGLVRDITRLKEAERRVELYNSLMRHDITNNSQLAHGYLEILMDTEMTDEQKKFADKAMKTLEKSRDLLQRVRAINKAKEKHKLRKFDIDDIIKKSIETYEHQAEDRGIKIEYEGKNVDVIADELAENVFSNIIGNAIIHSGCDKINIAVDEDENYCKVTISDNGRGIPEDIKKSVFEWGTKSKESEGSGLGLYLVKTIVESYGGRIELKDGKGEGTTFEIYLKKWGKSEGKQEDEN